jgi:hypothetical protein
MIMKNEHTLYKLLKKGSFILLLLLPACAIYAQAGKVGINTTSPLALFHVADSSVLFSASALSAGPPPISGPGIRLLWYPQKAAFRAGQVTSTQWNESNIGDASFAGGYNSVASGKYSTALGSIPMAVGENAVAIGRLVNAMANSSVSIGLESTAEGVGAVTIGQFNGAVGFGSVCLGSGNTAYGDNTSAIGRDNYAGNNNSMALGQNNSTIGISSVAMGYFTTADALRQITVGSYNEPLYTEDSENWIDTDPIFVIGNGEDENNPSTAMAVLKNGNTGIGMMTPAAKLEVAGDVVLGVNGSALQEIIKETINHDVASMDPNAESIETFTVTNAQPGSTVYVSPGAALPSGVLIAYGRVTASNTVEVVFCNIASTSRDPGAMDYHITVIR